MHIGPFVLFPSKGWPSHCNKVSWPSLVSCSWPASMEALSVPCTVILSDPARFFFLSTVHVLWRITILTKCTWLICGDIWRCRVFRCYDFACIADNGSQDTQSRNSGFHEDRNHIPRELIQNGRQNPGASHWTNYVLGFHYLILNSTLTTQFKTCLFFFLWHLPCKGSQRNIHGSMNPSSWILNHLCFKACTASRWPNRIKSAAVLELGHFQKALARRLLRYWSVLPWLFQRFVSFLEGLSLSKKHSTAVGA